MTNRSPLIPDQPADLAYAPPRYPSHGYTGRGTIWTIRVGASVVGHLTRQGDAVGWDSQVPPESDEAVVREIVTSILRRGAAEGRPLDDAITEILSVTQHESPVEAPLEGLQG